jgi:hypothetical protein
MHALIKNSCHKIYSGKEGLDKCKGEFFQQFIKEKENKNGIKLNSCWHENFNCQVGPILL